MTAVWLDQGHIGQFDALSAALQILEKNSETESNAYSLSFSTRIGLSVGRVTVGYVGNGRSRTVELVGKTVYEAARLEQLNKSLGTALLACDSFKEVRGPWCIQDKGEHRLKGFDTSTNVIGIVGIES